MLSFQVEIYTPYAQFPTKKQIDIIFIIITPLSLYSTSIPEGRIFLNLKESPDKIKYIKPSISKKILTIPY
jgi:hypothetical protein